MNTNHPLKGRLEITPDHQYKISFCIICMNRLVQLTQTLLPNILDNQDYDQLEIIILDYNSQDGMEAWFKENMISYIEKGKIVYYKTNQPKSFNHSHAKNLAFKLATGDIVCNINADHFTGKGFARFVNNQYTINNNIVITPITPRASDGAKYPKDVFGKVCVKKADFLNVKGFDERMRTYGFEDFDFINRLEMININRVLLDSPQYLKYLSHTDEERFSLEDTYSTLNQILIQHINPSTSNIIFLYHSGEFEMGKIIDHSIRGHSDFKYSYQKRVFDFEYGIEGSKWINGKWTAIGDNNILSLNAPGGLRFQLYTEGKTHKTTINDRLLIFHRLTDADRINEVLNFHYLFKNRHFLENNILKGRISPNENNFGEAIVYKNFDHNHPMHA